LQAGMIDRGSSAAISPWMTHDHESDPLNGPTNWVIAVKSAGVRGLFAAMTRDPARSASCPAAFREARSASHRGVRGVVPPGKHCGPP